MKIPATQLSLKHLRSLGYHAEVVEKYSQFVGHKDFINIIDIIAFKPGEILGVQTTSYSNAGGHRKKIREEPLLQDWLASGGVFALHLWLKPKYRYELKVETADDILTKQKSL